MEGNFIGTDVTGTLPLGNATCTAGRAGVTMLGPVSFNNTIGGTTPAARNLISANRVAIFIDRSIGNVVQGNFIGTDVTGTQPLGNITNMAIQVSSNNKIGGTSPGARNIISDGEFGIVFFGACTNNLVQGNYIGTDVTGTKALGNNNGVRWIGSTQNNIIGGDNARGRQLDLRQ